MGSSSELVDVLSRGLAAIDLSKTVAEIEINPLIVRTDGIDAVDAVVTLRSV